VLLVLLTVIPVLLPENVVLLIVLPDILTWLPIKIVPLPFPLLIVLPTNT